MLTTNAFAGIGALIGDPARAAMLDALMDGRALTATELSAAAGVTPQTASSHLAQLTGAGLLTVERQGRHRYHRLANAEVARMIEAIGSVAAKIALDRPARPRTGPRDQAMRQARTCYDHLAGRLAVAIADAMVARGHVEFGTDGGALTAAGSAFLSDVGIDLAAAGAKPSRKRVFCRPCLDWSERRPHIAGLVGASLCGHFQERQWLRPVAGSRALSVTPAGRRSLTQMFGLDDTVWETSAPVA